LDPRGRKWQEAGEDSIVQLYNLYTPPNIIGIIKSRRMRWEGHVALMDERRNL
jgi:hypothetical protein